MKIKEIGEKIKIGIDQVQYNGNDGTKANPF